MLSTIQKDGYQIIELNRGKANPINNAMVTAIREKLEEVAADDATRAIIWTGNTDGYFSVGLDLKELFFYDRMEIADFWVNWDAMVMELAAFPKPMVAAVNGYSPAGGCVLAITCDYRMMAASQKFVIGLNEIGVGITIPDYIFRMYAFWIGQRQAYQNLLMAKLMKPQEAHQIGLVDEVHEMESLLPRAEKFVQRLLRSPNKVVLDSKAVMRRELLEGLRNAPKANLQTKLEAWFHPDARGLMESVVKGLMKYKGGFWRANAEMERR